MIDSKIMGQFEVTPVDKPCAFSYVKFSGESENQHENGKFSSENAFCSVLLTLVWNIKLSF